MSCLAALHVQPTTCLSVWLQPLQTSHAGLALPAAPKLHQAVWLGWVPQLAQHVWLCSPVARAPQACPDVLWVDLCCLQQAELLLSVVLLPTSSSGTLRASRRWLGSSMLMPGSTANSSSKPSCKQFECPKW